MTIRVRLVVLGILAGGLVWGASQGCGRADRSTPEQLRAEIAALEKERDTLRSRLDSLVVDDPRTAGMPETSVRIGMPTTLARDLIQRVVAGVVDQVVVELGNIRTRKTGTVKRIVTLGEYDLRITINQVIARLTTGTPTLTFGGNTVSIALPVTVASGTGRATVRFKWAGKNLAGAVCGDMDVVQEVRGTVRPISVPVSGRLLLTSTGTEIHAEPRVPSVRLRLHVDLSKASWAAAQRILDNKEGVCGFVLEKVDVMGDVRRLIDRGFSVRLPTERIKPVEVPVGIDPTMVVSGRPVALGIRISDLAITEEMVWLGAHVSVVVGDRPESQAR